MIDLMRGNLVLLCGAMLALGAVILMPEGSPARTANAQTISSVNLLMQSYNPKQCSNQRTFCLADRSRCKSNQRERMDWRRDCRARYERAFKECTATLPAVRSNLNGPPRPPAERQRVQERYNEQRCGHTKAGTGRCEIEIASCPAVSVCNQQYGQCVRNQSAALSQPVDQVRDQPRKYEPAPPVEQVRDSNREPAREAKGFFSPSIKNQCAMPIMLAYVYEDTSGEQRKQGWVRVEPGKTKKLGARTDAKQFFIHAQRGATFSRMRSGIRRDFGVENAAFDGPASKVMEGSGARRAQFEGLEFSYREENPVIPIGSCADYSGNKRITPVNLGHFARPAPPKPKEEAEPASEVAPNPSTARPVGEVECTKLDVAAQGTAEAKRLITMHERGMIKLCGVD